MEKRIKTRFYPLTIDVGVTYQNVFAGELLHSDERLQKQLFFLFYLRIAITAMIHLK